MHVLPHNRFPLLGLLLAVGFAAGACSRSDSDNRTKSADSAQDSDATTEDGEKGDGSVDRPVWVNGTNLTCRWNSIESTSEAGIYCKLDPDEREKVGDLGSAKIQWMVEGANGKAVKDAEMISVSEDPAAQVLVLEAKKIAGSQAKVKIKKGGETHELAVAFNDSLEGVSEGSKLVECFNGDSPVAECFTSVGIEMSSLGDAFAWNQVDRADSACENPEEIPDGAVCQVNTDAIVGELDQANGWFQDGNELIAQDGTVRAERFCDENGIKARFEKDKIERKKRFYPRWDINFSPGDDSEEYMCFNRFYPLGASGTEAYRKTIVFDPSHGKDGEPYCYFALLSHPTVLGETFMRMHIIKNPNLFDDAANTPDRFSEDGLKTLSERFACSSSNQGL